MSRLRQIYTELHERICRESVSEEVYTALAVLIEILVQQEERLDLLEELVAQLHPTHKFTVVINRTDFDFRRWTMALTAPGTGNFAAQLLDNGSPITAPNPFTWSVDDTQATVTPSADTLSAVVTIPAGDPATTVTITASTTAPDGTTATGTLAVDVTAEAQKFTVTITQS